MLLLVHDVVIDSGVIYLFFSRRQKSFVMSDECSLFCFSELVL